MVFENSNNDGDSLTYRAHDKSPYRTAPHQTAPHRIKPHLTASNRTRNAAQRNASRQDASRRALHGNTAAQCQYQISHEGGVRACRHAVQCVVRAHQPRRVGLSIITSVYYTSTPHDYYIITSGTNATVPN
jgi:hypothetical protein